MLVLLKPAAWGAHALMVLGVAIAVAAGLWQYGTWNSHRSAAEKNLTDAAPVALSSLMGGDSAFPGESIGQPVTFKGTWLPAGTMFVSGQPHGHRNGYWAVTPVLIGKSAIPVVRGWTPRASAARASGPVTITGWLEPSEDNGEADSNPDDDIITSMRIPSMTQHVNADLYSAYVVAHQVEPANTAATKGLAEVGPTEQPDISRFTGLRNLLYALQWWVFGVLAIYIWYRWCDDQLHPREDEDPEGVGAADPPVPSSP